MKAVQPLKVSKTPAEFVEALLHFKARKHRQSKSANSYEAPKNRSVVMQIEIARNTCQSKNHFKIVSTHSTQSIDQLLTK